MELIDKPGISKNWREFVQNFYHQDEFFVVTERLRDFLVDRLPNSLEIADIDIRHHDGSLPQHAYFAVKVTRTIDCVDAQKSVWTHWSSERPRPFAEGITTYELGPEVAPEFANVDGYKYVSYPHWNHAHKVHLIESNIPPDAQLFRPAFWPSALIVTSEFATELERQCQGGSSGYYFWTLPLDSPNKEYNDLLRVLR
jgi:hypothetical protein